MSNTYQSLSPAQVEDGAGNFFRTIRREVGSGLVDPSAREARPRATYGDACIAFGQNDTIPHFKVAAASRERLIGLPGLRVVVRTPIKDSSGNTRVYPVPGVVLADSTEATGVRIGVLTAPNDIITDGDTLRTVVTRGFTPFQADMLHVMDLEHAPGTGEDVATPEAPGRKKVNFADVGHAALLASTNNPGRIHDRVHEVTGTLEVVTPSMLAPSIARTGAMHVGTPQGIRNVYKHIISGDAIGDFRIAQPHQQPSLLETALDLTPAEFVAGTIMAATDTRPAEYPRPNVAVNASVMAAQAA